MHNDDIRNLSAYIDGELDDADRDAIETALANSAKLRDELQRIRAVRSWANDFPGRQPNENVWMAIEDSISIDESSRGLIRTGKRPTILHRLMGMIPFYSRENGWSNGAKRTAIFGLAGIAIAGMGRSFYQEHRANLYEEKSRVADERLLRANTDAAWGETATEMRGEIGRTYSVRCPQNGSAGVVWGSGVYTDDSSICTAAVHAGVIDFERGGPVQIVIRPGQQRYNGTHRNGVSSHEYGAYPGSFAFVPGPSRFNFDFSYHFEFAPESLAETEALVESIPWDKNATQMRGWDGFQARFSCPPSGEASAVWGSGFYTDDSSICTAAVHAGLITLEDGGVVTIEIVPGRDAYEGESHNGIESFSYDEWPSSFRFVQ